MRALSAAIFVRDRTDEAAVRQFHAAGGRYALTPEQLAEKGDKYYDLRCKRMVNSKEVLLQTIPAVIERFAGTDGYDPATNSHVVTDLTRPVWEAVKQLITSGSFCGEYKQTRPPCKLCC